MKTFVLDYSIQLSSKEDCLPVECKIGKCFFSDVLKGVTISVGDVLVLVYYFQYIPTTLLLNWEERKHIPSSKHLHLFSCMTNQFIIPS